MPKSDYDTIFDISVLDKLIKDAYKKGHPKEGIRRRPFSENKGFSSS
jgi:hypothetical protein